MGRYKGPRIQALRELTRPGREHTRPPRAGSAAQGSASAWAREAAPQRAARSLCVPRRPCWLAEVAGWISLQNSNSPHRGTHIPRAGTHAHPTGHVKNVHEGEITRVPDTSVRAALFLEPEHGSARGGLSPAWLRTEESRVPTLGVCSGTRAARSELELPVSRRQADT